MNVLTNLFRVIRFLFIGTLMYIATSSLVHQLTVQNENETLQLQLKMLSQKTNKLVASQAELSKAIAELEKSSSHMVDETLRERDVFKYFKISSSDELLAVERSIDGALQAGKPKTSEIFENALSRVDDVDRNLNVLSRQLQGMSLLLAARADILIALPDRMPTDDGWISSGFGMRKSPINGQTVMHRGIDIAARRGTKVRATADGIVHIAGWKGSYGKLVTLNHGYGISTRYAHNSKILVKPGEAVTKGQVIAEVGATGRTTGEHLHYEVYINSQPVDPSLFQAEGKDKVNLAAEGNEYTQPMGGEEEPNFAHMTLDDLEEANAMAATFNKSMGEKVESQIGQIIWNPYSKIILVVLVLGMFAFLLLRNFHLVTRGSGQLIFTIFDRFVARNGEDVQDSAM